MTPAKPNSDERDVELTSAMFHILLTLAERERHGYAIMQEIERRTDGAVELGPGTLYRSIKQLVDRGLIAETDSEPKAGKRRRSYALTERGRRRAEMEARRIQGLVVWAEDSHLLHGGQA